MKKKRLKTIDLPKDNSEKDMPFDPTDVEQFMPDDDFNALDDLPLEIPDSDMSGVVVVEMLDAVCVPGIHQQLPVGTLKNMEAVTEAIENNRPVVILFCEDETCTDIDGRYCHIGVIGKPVGFGQGTDDPADQMFYFHAGDRVKAGNLRSGKDSHLYADVTRFPIDIDIDEKTASAIIKEIQVAYDRILSYSEDQNQPRMENVIKIYNPIEAFSFAIFTAPTDPKGRNRILTHKGLHHIMFDFLRDLKLNENAFKNRFEIRKKVQEDMADFNRDNFLRQELDKIREELGDTDSDDLESFVKRGKNKNWNAATQEHFDREVRKLQRFPSNTADYSVQSTYLEYFLSLPWEEYSESDFDFDRIVTTLDRDHFGLEKVKERILEQMAVAKLRSDNKAPILCLVGPPGVGKTSLGKSIAEAMDREYVRVSFGGMHDEAEIRGHRRTYLGAMPGRLMVSLSKCKTSNPVMVLDEIDKIGRDFKGDPSMALLEVLDPEQNSAFHDNYIEADYDLSHILFIATANSLETISAPLLDRMEIISIPGYITAEKAEIASRHLVRKELEANGLGDDNISFDHDALIYLIDYYTRESGVRRLQKMIARVLRKIAVKKVRGLEYPKVITRQVVSELLGKEEFNPEMYDTDNIPGVVTGLAWTSVGGEILFIEASVTEGKGKLTLTGNLGDVMKESASLALQYLRAHADRYGLTPENFDKMDVHIHVPEGAIPKDGPSAGITMTTALASALTKRRVLPRIAMTGEITLRGKVLPVGGIKEKIIAAKRAGIQTIILSSDNRKDITEIAPRYVEGLEFIYVDNINEVLDAALESAAPASE